MTSWPAVVIWNCAAVVGLPSRAGPGVLITSAWRYWWKLGSSTARMKEYPAASVALPPAAVLVVDGTVVVPTGALVGTGVVVGAAGADEPWRHWE